jgi:hypothetical protein
MTTTTTATEYEQLREVHRRLRVAGQRVIDGAEAVGDAEHPKVGLEPHILRALRRELQHEPHASTPWMSVS